MKKTGDPKQDKLQDAISKLEHALSFSKEAKKNDLYASAISKTFEVCLEYAWKDLKRRIVEEGIEVYSPKEVIKQAGRLGMIDDVEKWLDFLEDRNLAVHDYLGISDEDYLETIQSFLPEVRKILVNSLRSAKPDLR
ncbi:MAG: nucleotidyltransferase substrate binding protein [Deltaproteobacteria bacterium]|nr:nucleotidyltransferase substrate binding protein [Deltaproteobacteria bacterium]MBI4373778.1 nucleotidyltransferase substrate binding protein [Deltaproteobacteria bacterium]